VCVCVSLSVGVCVLLSVCVSLDKELELLSELPIEQSTSNMTGKITRKNLPVAVTDVEKLVRYRDNYIEARKAERRNGRIGLVLLIVGSLFQLVGLFFGR